MELQGRVADLEKLGLSVVAVSYDSVDTLAAFASARSVTFPLLSDRGSNVIRRYGLLNETVEPGSEGFGVPWPGTFVIDAARRVTSRYFEERYQERNTAGSIIARLGGGASGARWTASTAHLSVTGSTSDDAIAPGSRISLVFDVTPARGMHVYAPGSEYRAIAVNVDPNALLVAHETIYPASETYHFVPLNEKVPVYQRPFRLTRDVTVAATREAQQALRDTPVIKLTGALAYQACDDTLCFPPVSMPFTFDLKVKPLDRR